MQKESQGKGKEKEKGQHFQPKKAEAPTPEKHPLAEAILHLRLLYKDGRDHHLPGAP